MRLILWLILGLFLSNKWWLPRLRQRLMRFIHPQSNAEFKLDVAEAYAILGLTPVATREQIIAAHRRLIQKNHPDHGGSDYLASKINQAKKVLLHSLDLP
ncbi:MAG: hypothetical protein RL637_1803 [Pseudomonadota bacterium]|jgi:hypothetical protein